MKTLKLTKKHFKYSKYIGSVDLSDYDGSIEIVSNLGTVKFTSLKVTGSIVAGVGTGISAGEGISAGRYIYAGEGISAGRGIYAGRGISAGLGISAGYGISAGEGISAGRGISVGTGISAGRGIQVKFSICAGLSIVCTILNVGVNIFAGTLCTRVLEPEDTYIVCDRLLSGTVKCGLLQVKETQVH
jgi:hypothetical protein